MPANLDWLNIIVVDDGSTDGHPRSRAKSEFREVHLIQGNGDLWWTGSDPRRNGGGAHARGGLRDTDYTRPPERHPLRHWGLFAGAMIFARSYLKMMGVTLVRVLIPDTLYRPKQTSMLTP